MRRSTIIWLILLIIGIISCETEPPTQEIADAKYNIKFAKRFKANKFAPRKLKEAQELLAQAQVEFDKKKYRKAKKLALRAQEKALEAQKKSIPGFRTEYQAEKKNKKDDVTKMMEKFGYDNIVNKNKASKTTSSVDAKKLYIDNETEVILVTVDEESFDRLIKGSMANDKYTLNELLLTGKVFTVPKGTKVKVLDVTWGKKEIRIIEGVKKGRSGWVPSEWVK